MTKTNEGLEKLEELLESELGDYSSHYHWKIEEGEECWTVTFAKDYSDFNKDVHFKYDFIEKYDYDNHCSIKSEDKALFVDLYEDSWEEVDDYSWRAKYFWMALLDWN